MPGWHADNVSDPDAGARITWLASYPKSGNTWLRLLLEAYHRNGFVDINDCRLVRSDAGAPLVQSVSPQPIGPLQLEGELLLRPAGLLNLMSMNTLGVMVKTHFANLAWPGCAPCIPPAFTDRAIYVVRDPRAVFLSACQFFGYSLDRMREAMADADFVIGGVEPFARTWVSSWKNHVAGWIGEKRFPVHVVRYEDMQADTAKELREVLEFLGWDQDEDRIARAVEATSLAKLRQAEETHGFRENLGNRGQFFGKGRKWRDELGKAWAERIARDHGEVMQVIGYD